MHLRTAVLAGCLVLPGMALAGEERSPVVERLSVGAASDLLKVPPQWGQRSFVLAGVDTERDALVVSDGTTAVPGLTRATYWLDVADARALSELKVLLEGKGVVRVSRAGLLWQPFNAITSDDLGRIRVVGGPRTTLKSAGTRKLDRDTHFTDGAPQPGSGYRIESANQPVAFQWPESPLEVHIALIDSGVDEKHACFKGARITPEVDLVPTETRRDPWHGTAIAGLILGNETDVFKGVAPGAVLHPYRIYYLEEQITAERILGAIQRALADEPKLQIVSVSLSAPIADPLLAASFKQTLHEAAQRGVVVVTSAGNSGEACGQAGSPIDLDADSGAANPCVARLVASGHCCVTAAGLDGTRVTDVNYGAKSCCIAAPGKDFWSPIVPSNPANKNAYARWVDSSQTSWATGYVAGALALILQRGEASTGQEALQVLLKNAAKLPGLETRCQDGRFLLLGK